VGFRYDALVRDTALRSPLTHEEIVAKLRSFLGSRRRVAFITDATQGMYDRYGRTLAYLDKADGWDYSVEAARAGAARSYAYHGHPVARADEISAAEQEAKIAGRGLWGPPCFGETASVAR